MREDLEISEMDKKGDMELTEDKLNDDIYTDDEVGKEGTWSSSKDIVARDNDRRKRRTTQAKKSRRENCSVGSGSILSGIPLPARSREPRPGVIFVFEKASLVLAKVNKSYQIINPDEHAGFMKKHNLNRSDYRPDIIHEVLARLLGSRLNLTGGIQAVYVKTIQGHLIKIEPTCSVPRTLKSFCAMMTQLFQNLRIKASGRRSKNRTLLQMIQNPVTIHLPVGAHKIGLSSTSPKAVNLWEYFDTIDSVHPLVFVIGAMAHGKIDSDYTDDFIAVSGLPLSASLCVRRICNALERQWRIL
ncbi:ribosomal RNA small subunit methyltransferase nep-1 isoform X2 [Sesamum indicum]|nr:ribosomal RNA small subunit methyltransferase nep-1 isoform X2 [Sesamum indicum]XP_020547040.1 ribosomal RNA small subunit methyltransferase nep-1 isoform X2 [Sesamum indicum]